MSAVAGPSGSNDLYGAQQAKEAEASPAESGTSKLAQLARQMRKNAAIIMSHAEPEHQTRDSVKINYRKKLTFYELQKNIKNKTGAPSKMIEQEFASSKKLQNRLFIIGLIVMTLLVGLGVVLKYYQIPSIGSLPSLKLSTRACTLLRGCGILLGTGTVLTFLGAKSWQTHHKHQQMKSTTVPSEKFQQIILSLPKPYTGSDL